MVASVLGRSLFRKGGGRRCTKAAGNFRLSSRGGSWVWVQTGDTGFVEKWLWIETEWEQLAGLRRLSVAFVSFRVACASSSESTKNVSSTTCGAARLAV